MTTRIVKIKQPHEQEYIKNTAGRIRMLFCILFYFILCLKKRKKQRGNPNEGSETPSADATALKKRKNQRGNPNEGSEPPSTNATAFVIASSSSHKSS